MIHGKLSIDVAYNNESIAPASDKQLGDLVLPIDLFQFAWWEHLKIAFWKAFVIFGWTFFTSLPLKY